MRTTMRGYFRKGDYMVEERIDRLEKCYNELSAAVNKLLGQTGTVEMILKWVVLPLLIILGGLVGIKIAIP